MEERRSAALGAAAVDDTPEKDAMLGGPEPESTCMF